MELKLTTGRKSIEFDHHGETAKFEYDIVEMKLLAEELEIRHGLRRDGTEKVGAPTVPFLRDWAESLNHLGITGCTVDAGFRFYNLIQTQFFRMTEELETQIQAIAKG